MSIWFIPWSAVYSILHCKTLKLKMLAPGPGKLISSNCLYYITCRITPTYNCPEKDRYASKPSFTYTVTSATIYLLMRFSMRRFAPSWSWRMLLIFLSCILTFFCVLYESKTCLMLLSVCALSTHQTIYIAKIAVMQSGSQWKWHKDSISN